MIWLILGIVLWITAHLFKRLAPRARAALGDAGIGVVAIVLVVAIGLMVIGYKQADGAFLWGRTPMLAGINNLLVLIAVYLFAAAGMKTALARKMRHPMLIGVKVWALGHIIVNGDVPSFILFGGLMGWAVVLMIVINKSEPEWNRPEPAPVSREFTAVVAAVAVFGIIAMVHAWLGYPLFG